MIPAYMVIFACAVVIACMAYTTYVKASCADQLAKAVAEKEEALKQLEEAKSVHQEIQKDLEFNGRLKVEHTLLLNDIRNASEQLKTDIRRMASDA